jgi:hypothetical protein
MTLLITHDYGFFSCCSIRLHNIIEFFNKKKKCPTTIDSSQQFSWYKKNNNQDITFEYFQHYNDLPDIYYNEYINYIHTLQFSDYNNINYNSIKPFIDKYFSPSLQIKNIINNIEKKYNIEYDNTCVLYYRGNDKNTETTICNYNEYIKYAIDYIIKNKNIKFLIQSDETEFIELFLYLFPHNTFYFKDEIRHMKKCNNTVDKCITQNIDIYSKNYLAITVIMSKCKHIICGSGNCSIWIMLYRNNNNNVLQNLNNEWIYNKFKDIFIYGDAHALYSCKNITNNIINDNLSTIKDINNVINNIANYITYDINYICLVLGELDCRHYIKQLINNEEENTIIENIINNYITAIDTYIKNKKIIIFAIIPPVKIEDYENKNGKVHHKYTFNGTNEERVRYTNKMNKLLKEKCKEYNYYFFNPYTIYKNSDETLNFNLSNGSNHINNNNNIITQFIELYNTI